MLDVSEKEIVYAFEMRDPESSYLKPLYGKHSRKFLVLTLIAMLVLVVESVIMIVIDHSSSRLLWLLIPIFYAFYAVKAFLILPHKRRKYYEKVCEQNEDLLAYTFYTDCVKIQSSSTETVYQYDSAEYYAEDAERLRIVFALDRMIDIDKSQCDEEKLAFFRTIPSDESQKKARKKTFQSWVICLVALMIIAIFVAFEIAEQVHINQNAYYPEYQNTTYESFEACLSEGTIKDVVIINDKYVEYTFMNYTGDERYYTVCPGEIEHLIQKLDDADVNWETE